MPKPDDKKYKNRIKRYTFDLPKDLAAIFDNDCRRDGRSSAAMLRKILCAHYGIKKDT